MTLRHWFLSLCMLTGTVILVTVTTAQDAPVPPLPKLGMPTKDEPEKGIQVENRGPVHEAFANPGAAVRGGKEGSFADKAPPPPVPELPPDEKPSGDNVQWISGYWQWDIEKKDFIWVSGFWRNTPPGRTWTQGEWRVENGQHRYIPGFWRPSNENSRRIDLPEPPKSVENGPNVPAPHKDALWIPGHWVPRNENYVWQPGYWGEVEPNMMWTPPQYNYTGSGYCFTPGYWDYTFEDRGLLFAPVYFTEPLWLNAGWRFCPSFGVSIGFGGGWGWGWGGFYDSLFIGPGCGSFWFGGFWGPTCWGAGFRPWCWGGGGGFNNNCYNHYRWLNRNNSNWHAGNQARCAARNFGAIPGAGQRLAGNQFGKGGSNVNPNTINAARNFASKVGGEKMGQQVADRIAKGQAIQQANTALKQSGSMNVVQPAKQVLNNQALAQRLPSPSSVTRNSTDVGANVRSAALSSAGNNTMKPNFDTVRSMNNRPSLASNNSDAAMRNNINNAIRQAPTNSLPRMDSARVLPNNSALGNTRSSGGSTAMNNNALQGGSRNFTGSSNLGSSSLGSGSRSFSPPSMGSSSMGSTSRSFSPPSMGSSSMGSRGSFGGGSMGGSRGGMGGGGGGFGGGGSRGGGGGGGKK